MGVYRDELTSGSSLKWLLEKLHTRLQTLALALLSSNNLLDSSQPCFLFLWVFFLPLDFWCLLAIIAEPPQILHVDSWRHNINI